MLMTSRQSDINDENTFTSRCWPVWNIQIIQLFNRDLIRSIHWCSFCWYYIGFWIFTRFCNSWQIFWLITEQGTRHWTCKHFIINFKSFQYSAVDVGHSWLRTVYRSGNISLYTCVFTMQQETRVLHFLHHVLNVELWIHPREIFGLLQFRQGSPLIYL